MSEHTPITGDIRRWWELYISCTMDADLREGFGNLCDAIDAVHAELEKENERLRRELRGRPTVARLERENAALKAELDRVLGEQEEATTNIGEVTFTVTPTLDWSGVARELRAIADTLAGDAE